MRYGFAFLLANCVSVYLTFCQNYAQVGGGMSQSVNVLYTDTVDNMLYAGGNFVSVGNKYAGGIARWDGTKWDTLKKGLSKGGTYNTSGYILSIIRYKNEIFIGGTFDSIGGKPLRNLAKWNGEDWYSVGGGFPDQTVDAFHEYKGVLYAVGRFNKIENSWSSSWDVDAYGIAKWDGVKWSDVGKFPAMCNSWGNNDIHAVIEYKGEIYVGGHFSCLNNMTKVARYNPNTNTWQSLGNGITGGDPWVNVFEIYKGELYVGGHFYESKGAPGTFIAKWDGTNWSSVGKGFSSPGGAQVDDLAIFANELYAVGQFSWTGNWVPAQMVAKWDGTRWCGLGDFFNSNLLAISVYEGTFYIGGGVRWINNDTTIDYHYIAKWVGKGDTDTCETVIGSVENSETSSGGLYIFPNPATRNLSIKFNLKSPPRGLTVTLYALCGQEVYREDFGKISGTTEKTIDLSSLAQGMYLCKVQAGGEIMYRKVVRY